MTEDIGSEIVWSLRARRDLESIRAYIGQFAPLTAQRFALRLIGAVESLAHQPHRGHITRGDLRELVVISPYIVRYRIVGEQVFIVRIRHGAQRPG
jgi:addiction module RelE/StbE family toxin